MIKSQPKPVKIVQDEERLEFVRNKLCLITGWTWGPATAAHLENCASKYLAGVSTEAHHVRKGTQTGLSRKPPASRTVPLCAEGHREYHAIGHAAFEAKYGLDLEAQLVRINREFEATHPRPAKKRARKPTVGLTVRNCIGCGQTHAFLPKSKWQAGSREIRYFCSRRNSYFVWEMK